MSELKQEKKQLTFEEICPIWYKILTGQANYTPRTSPIDIGDHKYCVVGESHRFKSEDARYNGCIACEDFSFDWSEDDQDFYHEFTEENGVDLKIVTPEELDRNPIVQKFVKHFNEVHVK
jgi:hypothetical protein